MTTKVLILGVTGMLGNAVFKLFSHSPQYEVWGTLRNENGLHFFPKKNHLHLISGVDALNQDLLTTTINRIRPQVIINCIGLIKQMVNLNNPELVFSVNSILPHRLAQLTSLIGGRLIHISTDCVFSGRKGGYREDDESDVDDLYGRSKYTGELANIAHAITLRTSIIGHELNSQNALVEWFLSKQNQIKGYTKAIFSGLPSIELARAMRDFILPQPHLNGIYHVSAQPISKFDLLKLISKIYGKKIEIIPDTTLTIDRSLNSERFTHATGYVAPNWSELVQLMHKWR